MAEALIHSHNIFQPGQEVMLVYSPTHIKLSSRSQIGLADNRICFYRSLPAQIFLTFNWLIIFLAFLFLNNAMIKIHTTHTHTHTHTRTHHTHTCTTRHTHTHTHTHTCTHHTQAGMDQDGDMSMSMNLSRVSPPRDSDTIRLGHGSRKVKCCQKR